MLAIARSRNGIGRRVILPEAYGIHYRWFRKQISEPLCTNYSNVELKPTALSSLRHRRCFWGSHVVQASSKGDKEGALKQTKGGFVGWYLNSLNKRPVVTKSLTACTIYTTADLVAQRLTGDNAPWDHVRTLRMSAVGLFMSGPTLHLWFNFLNRILPGRDLVSTLKKMLLGQTTYGPAFTASFFSINALAQGENGAEICQRLKRDLIPTLANGLMYWPFCDLITFRYVPVHLQPLVCNSFSLVWTVYLTYMAGLKKTQ